MRYFEVNFFSHSLIIFWDLCLLGIKWEKKVLTFPGSNQSAVCHHAFNLHGGVCVWPSGGVWPTFQPWVTSRLYAPAALQQDLIIISQNQWQSSTCWSVFAETCYSSHMNEWCRSLTLWHAGHSLLTEAGPHRSVIQPEPDELCPLQFHHQPFTKKAAFLEAQKLHWSQLSPVLGNAKLYREGKLNKTPSYIKKMTCRNRSLSYLISIEFARFKCLFVHFNCVVILT